MPTLNLGLPTITGNQSADIVSDLNALAEEVDLKVAGQQEIVDVSDDLTTHKAEDVTQGNPHGIDAKANKVQENWIEGVLQNGWTGIIKYAKNDVNLVTLKLECTIGAITNGTVIATLPIGYRPDRSVSIPNINVNKGHGAVTLSLSWVGGTIEIYNEIGNNLITGDIIIANLTYYVEA